MSILELLQIMCLHEPMEFEKRAALALTAFACVLRGWRGGLGDAGMEKHIQMSPLFHEPCISEFS
ncbi:Fast Kinase Domain-Containing Protein 5 [Manis pentadactyla]|nr:Fast Kinase Domain-Containing Protein 5 [Manis pentadactyla]